MSAQNPDRNSPRSKTKTDLKFKRIDQFTNPCHGCQHYIPTRHRLNAKTKPTQPTQTHFHQRIIFFLLITNLVQALWLLKR